ncbi:MAG: hypothetical protein IPM55_13370 [Acidobacteria bacterium]|nr:hypothetical protein [Acidobacteriota bacterium]
MTIYPTTSSASNHYNKLGVLFGGLLGVGPDSQKSDGPRTAWRCWRSRRAAR